MGAVTDRVVLPLALGWFDLRGDSLAPDDRDLLLNMNPPDHTRVRRLLSPAFNPASVAELAPLVRRIVVEHFDRLQLDDVEVVSDLAYPIPIRVICELLGVPTDDARQLKEWGMALGAGLDFLLASKVARRRDVAVREVCRYFDELIAKRRAEPGDALLDTLISAGEAGEKLSTGELRGTCLLLLIAGFETTVNLLGTGTLALARRPDEFEALREEPELVPGAVEEMLRFETPVQATMRVAKTEQMVGGATIPAGAQVATMLGAANRDEEAFPDAGRFDIRRANADRHVTFGSGIHYCLGAALARLEARVFFEVLTERVRGLEPHGPKPAYRDLVVLRGLNHLRVTMAPA